MEIRGGGDSVKHLLIKQHGDEAAFVAAQRSDALFAKGDAAGSSVWIEIGRAISELGRAGSRERARL